MGTRTTGTSGSPSNKSNDGHLVEYFNSQFQSKTGTSGWFPAAPGPQSATGGIKTVMDDKTIHTFIATGSLVCNANFDKEVEYVVIGGGGSGAAAYHGGGGGAGGMNIGSGHAIGSGTHPVTIGAGGAQKTAPGSGDHPGNWGTDTVVSVTGGTPIIGAGGGNGGGNNGEGGGIGGSGGGGAGGPFSDPLSPDGGEGQKYNPTSPAFPGAAPGQGYDGGAGSGTSWGTAGGGGGAGFSGGAGTGPNPSGAPGVYGGHGGIGKILPATFQDPQIASDPGFPAPILGGAGPGSAPQFWFCGGGGGSNEGAGTGGLGGSNGPTGLIPGGPYDGAGGGGDNPGFGGAATANTGSGGGGAGRSQPNPGGWGYGGAGGSGIVLIAYPTEYVD